MKVLDKIQKHKFSDFDVKKGFMFHALDIMFSTVMGILQEIAV